MKFCCYRYQTDLIRNYVQVKPLFLANLPRLIFEAQVAAVGSLKRFHANQTKKVSTIYLGFDVSGSSLIPHKQCR